MALDADVHREILPAPRPADWITGCASVDSAAEPEANRNVGTDGDRQLAITALHVHQPLHDQRRSWLPRPARPAGAVAIGFTSLGSCTTGAASSGCSLRRPGWARWWWARRERPHSANRTRRGTCLRSPARWSTSPRRRPAAASPGRHREWPSARGSRAPRGVLRRAMWRALVQVALQAGVDAARVLALRDGDHAFDDHFAHVGSVPARRSSACWRWAAGTGWRGRCRTPWR